MRLCLIVLCFYALSACSARPSALKNEALEVFNVGMAEKLSAGEPLVTDSKDFISKPLDVLRNQRLEATFITEGLDAAIDQKVQDKQDTQTETIRWLGRIGGWASIALGIVFVALIFVPYLSAFKTGLSSAGIFFMGFGGLSLLFATHYHIFMWGIGLIFGGLVAFTIRQAIKSSNKADDHKDQARDWQRAAADAVAVTADALKELTPVRRMEITRAHRERQMDTGTHQLLQPLVVPHKDEMPTLADDGPNTTTD